VLAVEYRQGPEHPFPAAVEDAMASYRWLLESTSERVFVVGDSAGGALAVTAGLQARVEGLRRPRGVVAVSGVFDLTLNGESWHENAGRDLITREMGAFLYGAYLAGQDPRHPAASPVYADFDGAPPMLIQVGGDEVLLDDSRRLVYRARSAGAEVTVQIFAGMPHNFIKFNNPLADDAFRHMTEWARRLRSRD
jgi:acetyl esterase/lipase